MELTDNLSPEEIRLATIQFMGQHLMGDLKELNKNIVSQNQTLRGMSIDPERVVNTIPAPPRVVRPQTPINPMHTTVNAGINVPQAGVNYHQPIQHVQVSSPQPQAPAEDPNQLTFNFKQTDIDDIFNKLDSISKKLDLLLNKH